MRDFFWEMAARTVTAVVIGTCLFVEITLHISTTTLYKLHLVSSTWRKPNDR